MANPKLIEGVKAALENAKQRKFEETVELAINFREIDLNDPKNRLREEIPLPNGRGKPTKIAVFGTGEFAAKARELADKVISPEELEKLADDKRSQRKLANTYDFFLAEAPLMPEIGRRLGQILGPRNKMPRPLPPMADPRPLINSLRNSVRLIMRKQPVVHLPIGTKSMSPEALVENIEAVLRRLESKLERGRWNIKSVYVKTTMGSAVKLTW